jgi:hypothetical protein
MEMPWSGACISRSPLNVMHVASSSVMGVTLKLRILIQQHPHINCAICETIFNISVSLFLSYPHPTLSDFALFL